MSAHTPTPWKVLGDSTVIRDQGDVIGEAICEAEDINSFVQNEARNTANAAFIVKACNAWNDAQALQMRLAELFLANPDTGATERLMRAIDLADALGRKTPQQLVDLCLDHLSEHTTDESFASLVTEICARLDPTWGDRAEAEDAARARS